MPRPAFVLPEERLKIAYQAVIAVAGLSMAAGGAAVFFQIPFLKDLGIGIESVIVGMLFGVLGFFVKRRSTAALAICVALFALDGIVAFTLFARRGGGPVLGGGIGVRIMLLLSMIRGFGAIRAIKAAERGEITENSWDESVATDTFPVERAPALAEWHVPGGKWIAIILAIGAAALVTFLFLRDPGPRGAMNMNR